MCSRQAALLRPLGPGDAATRGDVEVPASGVTHIGRGPFLGVTDKRVSREHGLLELVDGRLRLKPLHVNPCYHGPRGSAALRPLPRDEWMWLEPGDRLALLADAFVYEIIYVPEDSCADESVRADDEHQHVEKPHVDKEALPMETKGERLIDSSESEPCTSQRGQQGTGLAALNSDNTGPKKENPTSCTPDTSQNLPHLLEVDAASGGQPNIQKKRKLPAWMLVDDDEQKSPSKAKEGKGKGRAKPQEYGGRTGKRSASESDEDEVEIWNKKRKISTIQVKEQWKGQESRNEEPGSCDDLNKLLNKSRNNLAVERNLANTSVAGDPWQKEEAVPSGKTDQRDVPHTSASQSVSSQRSLQKEEQQHVAVGSSQRHRPSQRDPGSEGKTSPQNMRRTPCLYAERCYRKNPLHFQECSHPGDLDYVVDEVADTDKPDCQYGTSCYRQNPQHKLAFNHTNPPVAGLGQTRRKTTKRVIADDSGDESEYSDLEDSFIDDDSEMEVGSEWEPEHSDEEEDLKTLTKEAKQFTRKKKV